MKSSYIASRGAATRKRIRRYKRVALVCLGLVIVAGGYLAFLLLSPDLMPKLSHNWNTAPVHKGKLTQNRLYIPKLKLNLPYNTGDASVLSDGAWHRYPERGDPVKGGNFILAGHRFYLGLTPGETARRSPFYRLNDLHEGDKIYVDFEGQRYEYKITKNYTVKPTQIEIEAPSDTPKMTLYSCTLKGSADGREVVEAIQTATDVGPRQNF